MTRKRSTASEAPAAGAATEGDVGSVNQVVLAGRLSAVREAKELPSGDLLTAFDLTVPRPAGERGRVDTIECATFLPRVRAVLERAEVGDVLEVEGRLRRRFWRSPGGPVSRYNVEVTAARRPRAGRAAAGSPGRTPASV